ncbi:citrate synthase [Actinoplanes sp. ATCC 53533]|uniref:citrate synthase n=1 Tax=Actinoplanes sp. ATCC 53533 TaxID=1288362 RepID=UPI000F794236|nr:citrate synthase [Actinoplanes sp. ATCC 53533]RSM54832.1 citrate synthase [Actinoplanes sp. ATCC 53533]
MSAERLLTTEEVARRLGVKKATVYAYVSRGLLGSRRNADGKESLFAEPDVAAFVARRKRPGAVPDAPAIHTGITLITGDELFYRGHNARVLAGTASFESVVTLLWTSRLAHVPVEPDPELRALAEAVTVPLPAGARSTDRLRVTVAAIAAVDRLRFDTTPAAVIARGRTILGTMVAALPVRAHPPRGQALADALWCRLTDRAPTAAGVAALNAALVLLADHDLAASTFAARVAASTRAHPYAVIQAGLAALDGPLHGAASDIVFGLLTEVMRSRDAVGAIADRLRADGWLAGFGHPLYPAGDPRAAVLLGMLAEPPVAEGQRAVRAAMADATAAMERHSGAAPNIDFALAALALLHGMAADAGETIFAVARTAGWIAHALEEYADEPSRFRPNGRYSGQSPGAVHGVSGGS